MAVPLKGTLMPNEVHGAHALVESIAAVVLIAAGLVVLGLMVRRRRLGLGSSVVRSDSTGVRTALSVAIVPVVGLAFIALLVVLAQPAVQTAVP